MRAVGLVLKKKLWDEVERQHHVNFILPSSFQFCPPYNLPLLHLYFSSPSRGRGAEDHRGR